METGDINAETIAHDNQDSRINNNEKEKKLASPDAQSQDSFNNLFGHDRANSPE